MNLEGWYRVDDDATGEVTIKMELRWLETLALVAELYVQSLPSTNANKGERVRISRAHAALRRELLRLRKGHG